MATTKQKETPMTESTALEKQPEAQLPAEMAADLAADAQGGQGFGAQDIAIPFLRVAQSGTPERKKTEPEYITGLEEGDIYNTVTKQFWKGDAGAQIIPCLYRREVTEWKPNRGGLVKIWGPDTSILDRCTSHPERQMRLVSPDGNDIVEAATYYVLIPQADGSFERAVVSLSSTQWAQARRWNTQIGNLQITDPTNPQKKINPAMFYMSYKMTTAPEKNDDGTWFGVRFATAGATPTLENGTALYYAAREFAKLVREGSVKAAAPLQEERSAGGSGAVDKDIPF